MSQRAWGPQVSSFSSTNDVAQYRGSGLQGAGSAEGRREWRKPGSASGTSGLDPHSPGGILWVLTGASSHLQVDVVVLLSHLGCPRTRCGVLPGWSSTSLPSRISPWGPRSQAGAVGWGQGPCPGCCPSGLGLGEGAGEGLGASRHRQGRQGDGTDSRLRAAGVCVGLGLLARRRARVIPCHWRPKLPGALKGVSGPSRGDVIDALVSAPAFPICQQFLWCLVQIEQG